LAEAYQKTAEELLALEVPARFSQNHLDIINGSFQISKEIRGMQKLYTDPATGIVSFKQYLTSRDVFGFAMQNINSYFENNQIAFGKTDSGNLLKIYSAFETYTDANFTKPTGQ